MQYRVKTIIKKCCGITNSHYIIQYRKHVLWFYIWKDFVTPEVVFISSEPDETYGMGKISYKYKWYWDKTKLLKYVNELNTLPDNIILTDNGFDNYRGNYLHIYNYYIDITTQINVNGYIFCEINKLKNYGN